MYDLEVLEKPASPKPVAGLMRDYALWLRREFADAPDIADTVIDNDDWETTFDVGRKAPFGAMVIAHVDDVPAGFAMMRGLDGAACILNGLFVRPAFRGHDMACRLLVRAGQLAVERGYRCMLTLAGREQTLTHKLRALGFSEVAVGEKYVSAGPLAVFRCCTSGLAAGGCADEPTVLAA